MQKAAFQRQCFTSVFVFAALVTILCLSSTISFAQWADPAADLYQEAISHYRSGDLQTAIETQKKLIEILDFEQRPADAWMAIETLYIMCQAPGMPGLSMDLDIECMEWVSPYLNKLPLIVNDRDITALRILYFIAIPTIYMNNAEWIRALFDQKILEGQEQYVDTVYYVNRQLLAAEAHIALDEFAEARKAVERALASILAVENGHNNYWQISRWLLAVCNIFLELNDIRMAQSLFAAASPLIFQSFAPDSPDMLAANSIAAAVFFKAALPTLAHTYTDEVVRIVDKTQSQDGQYHYIRDYALSVRLGSCFIVNDYACIDAIARDEKQSERVSFALASPDQPTTYSLLEFIAARSTALWLIGKPVSQDERTRTIALLEEQLPRIADSHYENFLRFGLGLLRFQDNDKKQAKDLLISVAKSTISEFRRESKALVGHIPIPQTDQWIMWMIMVTMSIGGDFDAEYQDLIVAMASGLQRTSLNVEGDFLSLIANASSEHQRQVAHSYLRTISRQRSFYTTLTNKLVYEILERIAEDPNVPLDFLTIDYSIRRQVSEYAQRRARLYDQLNTRDSHTSALPHLDQIQNVLAPDEAVLLHATFSGVRVTVCVRSDSVQLAGSVIDDAQQAMMDVKLIQLALDGRHSPSIELDRQFPVMSAVRLYDLALRPVEDCLRQGDTVYVSGRSDSFPWEVLLEEVPEVLGSGYDLAAAKWAMKRFSFAYFGTSLEFVSGKLIDRRGRQSSGFFGIGDPVLEGKTEKGISRRGVVQRGMLRGENQSMSDLAELPDTAQELRTISELFQDDYQILTRQDATEASMRRSRLEGFEYLSFATHGLMREELPGLREAALVLTPVDASNSLNDGLLTASEIADLRLNARVAFLSACNTSSIDTDLFMSEVHSFSAAFATAGVPATISTLSYVDSMTARVVAEKAFEHLIGNQKSVAQALAAAKVEFVEQPPSPEYSHPRFWAPIISIGNSLPRESDADEPILAFDELKTVSKRGGEVRAIITDITTNEVFLRYSGNPVRRDDQDGREELQSYVAKFSSSGEMEWTWTRLGSGSSGVLLDTGDVLIAPGAGVKEIRDGLVIQGFVELSAVDRRTGQLAWTRQIEKSMSSAWPAAGIVTSDGHILLLIVEWDSSDLDSTDTDFQLIKFTLDGEELSRRSFPKIIDRLDLSGNVSLIEDAGNIYLIFSKSVREEDYDLSWDDFHNPNACDTRRHAQVLQLDPETFDVVHRSVFPDRQYGAAIPRLAGGFLLVGSEFKDCRTRSQIIVSEFQGGHIRQDYRDQLSNDSSGSAAVVLRSGNLLVLGDERRQLAPRSYAMVDGEFELDVFSFDKERLTEETIMDGLVILLGPDLKERGREWLEGGADVSFTAGALIDDAVLLGGLNGSTAALSFVKVGADP